MDRATVKWLVWNRRTPTTLRAWGIDFGPFALVILTEAKKT